MNISKRKLLRYAILTINILCIYIFAIHMSQNSNVSSNEDNVENHRQSDNTGYTKLINKLEGNQGSFTYQDEIASTHISSTVKETDCRIPYVATKECLVEINHGFVGAETFGRLKTRQSTYTWQTCDQKSIIFTLNSSCHISSIQEFSCGEYIEKVEEYLDNIPKRSIIAGVISKHHTNSSGLCELLGSCGKYQNYKFKDSEPFIFLTLFGYQGHLHWEHVNNGSRSTVRHEFHIGTPFNFNVSSTDNDSLAHLDVSVGGSWRPPDCQPTTRLALIIPYRNRPQHRDVFLPNIITFLKMQRVEFTIFILEQIGEEFFNRAALMNIGYIEAKKMGQFDCFVFHDVDMIPEDLSNLYQCDTQPRHLILSRSVTGHTVRSKQKHDYFGGAIALTTDHINAINGFSNQLFGWGGEDDEMLERLYAVNSTILRYPDEIGTYFCLTHEQDKSNPHIHAGNQRNMQWHGRYLYNTDGLSNVNYILDAVTLEKLYTRVSVRIPGPKDEAELEDYLDSLYVDIAKMRLEDYCNSVRKRDRKCAFSDLFNTIDTNLKQMTSSLKLFIGLLDKMDKI